MEPGVACVVLSVPFEVVVVLVKQVCLESAPVPAEAVLDKLADESVACKLITSMSCTELWLCLTDLTGKHGAEALSQLGASVVGCEELWQRDVQKIPHHITVLWTLEKVSLQFSVELAGATYGRLSRVNLVENISHRPELVDKLGDKLLVSEA